MPPLNADLSGANLSGANLSSATSGGARPLWCQPHWLPTSSDANLFECQPRLVPTSLRPTSSDANLVCCRTSLMPLTSAGCLLRSHQATPANLIHTALSLTFGFSAFRGFRARPRYDDRTGGSSSSRIRARGGVLRCFGMLLVWYSNRLHLRSWSMTRCRFRLLVRCLRMPTEPTARLTASMPSAVKSPSSSSCCMMRSRSCWLGILRMMCAACAMRSWV